MFSKDKENLDAIELGAVETADMCNFYHPGRNPAWMVFPLPFLPMEDLRVGAAAADATMKHPILLADMAKWGAVPYFFTILPQYEFMGKGKPPKALDDWKGLRVRAPGAVGDAFKILGAHISTVPAVELYTALDRGTVDAASFPFTYAHAAYQLHTISNWYTANLAPGTAGCAAVMSLEAHAKLPPQYQRLQREAQPQAYKAMIEAYEAADKVNLPMFKQKLTEVRYRMPTSTGSARSPASRCGTSGSPTTRPGSTQGRVRYPAQGARGGKSQAQHEIARYRVRPLIGAMEPNRRRTTCNGGQDLLALLV